MAFDLPRLPPEIRNLIWEATLPPRRVFHVSGIADLGRPAGPRSLPEKALGFHIRHAPPAAAHVCRESRAVALLRGGFLFAPPAASLPGPWFNPRRDLLYFDRTKRESLRFRRGQPTVFVHGWQHVLHLALDWGFFFHHAAGSSSSNSSNSSSNSGADQNKFRCGRTIRALRHCMPNLKAIHYLFHKEPHQVANTWYSEDGGHAKLEAVLVMLPEAAGIWCPSSIPDYYKEHRPSAQVLLWENIRNCVQEAVDGAAAEEEASGEFERQRLQVKGWWMTRRGRCRRVGCLIHQ